MSSFHASSDFRKDVHLSDDVKPYFLSSWRLAVDRYIGGISAPIFSIAHHSISGLSALLPADVGFGKTDLVVVSECMPLLDPVALVREFHKLLGPGGARAVYFYGRPLLADDQREE